MAGLVGGGGHRSPVTVGGGRHRRRPRQGGGGLVRCDPLFCMAIAKVLHGAALVGDATPWILVRRFLGRLLEMGEGGHLHSCGSLSEPCSGSNLGGIRGGVCGWRAFGA